MFNCQKVICVLTKKECSQVFFNLYHYIYLLFILWGVFFVGWLVDWFVVELQWQSQSIMILHY